MEGSTNESRMSLSGESDQRVTQSASSNSSERRLAGSEEAEAQ